MQAADYLKVDSLMDLTCTAVANLAKGAPVSTPLPAPFARVILAAVSQASQRRRWRLRSATLCHPAASAGAQPAQRRSIAVERRSLHNGSPRRNLSTRRCWRDTSSPPPFMLPTPLPAMFAAPKRALSSRHRKGSLQRQPRRGGGPPPPPRCERPRNGSSAWSLDGWLAGSGRRGAPALLPTFLEQPH